MVSTLTKATVTVAFAMLTVVQSSPVLAQTAAATTAVENPTVTALARAQLDALRAGKIDRSQYTSQVNAHFTDSDVASAAQLFGRGGAVKTFAYAGNEVRNGITVSQYTVEFEHPISVPMMPTTANWIESIATDKGGKISYIAFDPKK
ncbi:MAG: hypothetical protein JO024_01730 [Candidatus Eremiobacteraeota bacterium]|nr:hypothetical protein [Candidatus Eremiobacteraeota bacterium]